MEKPKRFTVNVGAKDGVYARIHAAFVSNKRDYYENPALYYIRPFQIADNLYYIGDRKVCSHLIDTGDGLIVFDSGYAHAAHLMIQAIWELGFNPKDVRYIIHSHGHFDHFGAGAEFRTLFGSKLMLSRIDYARVKENPELALLEYGPTVCGTFPEPDVLIEDGDVISLGNTSIRCVLAPGHTEGTLAFFFETQREEQPAYTVGYLGGVGFFTMFRAFQQRYNIRCDMQKAMRETVKKMREESVDITLGNHPYHNATLERRAYMLDHPGENPFIDREAWPDLLNAIDDGLNYFEKRNL